MTEQELANQMVFGKVDQQLILMAFAHIVKKQGGITVDLNELREFAEADEPVDLAWKVDNTGMKLTFTTEPPLADALSGVYLSGSTVLNARLIPWRCTVIPVKYTGASGKLFDL